MNSRAQDLSKEFPRSPRETLAGYIHAARMLDLQQVLEDYIPKFVPKGRVVRVWFDVYDLEEGRI